MANVIVGYIIPVIHVFACLLHNVVVLLQTGKWAGAALRVYEIRAPPGTNG